MAAILEMESYVSGTDRVGITAVEVEDDTAAVAAVSPIDKLTRTVEHLAERVETLQSEVARWRRSRRDDSRRQGRASRTGQGQIPG